MQPEPKQQHYIPETYSKHFSDEKGLIAVYDMWENCRIFRTNPKTVFKENYLYSQPVHAENRFDNAIERLFSNHVENSWSKIVSLITEKKTLSREELKQFFEFFLCMRCRVPNTLKSVIKLLRESVTKLSAEIPEPAPDLLAKIYRERDRKPSSNSVGMQDLIDANVVQVCIDPHTALLSMSYIIQSMSPVMDRVNAGVFLHNKTDLDFISSDNPVCYFRAGSHIDDVVPYAVDLLDEFELIFPLTSRIALCIDSRKREIETHRNTYSRKTVARINGVIALFAERYIFGCREDSKDLAISYSTRCPVPDFEKSIVGNGLVQRVGYKIGQPSALSNTWEYPFRR